MTASPPSDLLWLIGSDHTDAWESAAAWMHLNVHLDPNRHPLRSEPPCHSCWRAAAFAVKGVVLSGYRAPTPCPDTINCPHPDHLPTI